MKFKKEKSHFNSHLRGQLFQAGSSVKVDRSLFS